MSAAIATDAPKGVPERELDGLFRGPLEEFTEKRNALAKQLRADAGGEAAAWVKRLRKPTRAAWLVNQLGVRKRDAVQRLISIGEELRGLQSKLIGGEVEREALREAARREQAAIDELVRAAEAIGREHGVGAQILDRVAETLRAATSDPQVAEALGRGRLQREARATSLGLVGEATSAPTRRGGGATKRKGGREETERRERENLARRRRAAERAVARAEKRLEREREAVERAREALAERERRLDESERELARACRELEDLGR